MALKKYPYELSVWIERFSGDGKKTEEKGTIIGAHDMSYAGKATNIVFTTELKGTHTLTFQMPDSYFDSMTGELIHNELIDILSAETKIKLFYKKNWYEFFIKKVDEKQTLNSVIKSFTCNDAFIDELSRNGYNIFFDTELYNNVEETGTFTQDILEDSLWEYHPEHNWGDFTEFTEEKLFKIPVSQFSKLCGYKLDFSIDKESIPVEKQDMLISNAYTGEERVPELSDDLMSGVFWDQHNREGKLNPLTKDFIENIPNDGYIYVPYSCLNFCYGSQDINPNTMEELKYDRAATETALTVNDKLVIAPDSVDPRTIIQFIAYPPNTVLQIDDAGVILDKDYSYFMTLDMWNQLIADRGEDTPNWYIFEDTRLVKAESLGSSNLAGAEISHTFKYLSKIPEEEPALRFLGNKWVTYEGYLNDIDNNLIVKGKKFSITNRTELNITEEIDQYTTVYNNFADEYTDLYTNNNANWTFNPETDSEYRVCSKTETRQIVPQLARNLIQNGLNIQSTDGWSPRNYLNMNKEASSGTLAFKTILAGIPMPNLGEGFVVPSDEVLGGAILYIPPRKSFGYQWNDISNNNYYSIGNDFYTEAPNNLYVFAFNRKTKSGREEYKQLSKTTIEGKTKQKIKYIYPQSFKEVDENATTQYKISYSVQNENQSTQSYEISLSADDFGAINFGIIGQEKKIEKGKIYCLGIGCLAGSDDVTIQIGEGSLISDGNYHIEENPIEFSLANDIYSEIDKSDWLKDPDNSKAATFWQQTEDNTSGLFNLKIKESFILFKAPKTIENPYFIINTKKQLLITSTYLFEAYTKGRDCFSGEDIVYNYSGRDLFGIEQPPAAQGEEWENNHSKPFTSEEIKNLIIFENDVMLGSTYGYQKYYIQRLKADDWGEDSQPAYYDTMGKKEFVSEKNLIEGQLPLDASKYTEDNYTIETNYIDMNNCKYYNTSNIGQCDCSFGNEDGISDKVCFYQKFGYCPYRFEAEKHCRKIRTLTISKSNRFNAIQELSKVFQCYPQFYIQHTSTGAVLQEGEDYLKEIFYITEKGKEDQIGFRYKKDLSDATRSIDSSNIVTKLYVLDVDSELSKTGLCSIKTAEDNPSKDNYIIDLSYFIEKGYLDADEVEQDLWGVDPENDSNIPSGFLRQLGYYNEQYDKISNKIINLQDASYNELEANLTVNLEGIVTAQEQLIKIKKQLDKYTATANLQSTASNTQSNLSSTVENYQTKYNEQEAILSQLVADTFFTDGTAYVATDDTDPIYNVDGISVPKTYATPMLWFECIKNLKQLQKVWVDEHVYPLGILGQFNKEYLQIQAWKKERSSYLKEINRISAAFYKKYESYLKEGTWSDSNYLTDNAYYFGALDVAAQGSIPKVTYTFNVIDLDGFENKEIGDTTYVEDVPIFGVNQKTGLPNRIKVLISSKTENLDTPSSNSIGVQNFTTQFEDLFQQVTASVQSLTFNENIYKRSSNFTPMNNISKDSLQGTLDSNDLTIYNTAESNIKMDNTGTRGSDINNHANKYKLDGQGLFFSNDGGAHWNVGVGPSGINADYIRVGTLDAGKIRIADSSYVYFAWDKDGICAYRDPLGINSNSDNISDAAIFNKFGLSIIQNGNIRLRAGYSYNGSENEDNGYSGEVEQGEEVGFYLYNNAGQVIFSTEASNGKDAASQTAKLNLSGEILVTNNNIEPSADLSYTYSDEYKKVETIKPQEVIDLSSLFDKLTKSGETYIWQQPIKNENVENQIAAIFAYVKSQNKEEKTVENGDKVTIEFKSVNGNGNKTYEVTGTLEENKTENHTNDIYFFVSDNRNNGEEVEDPDTSEKIKITTDYIFKGQLGQAKIKITEKQGNGAKAATEGENGEKTIKYGSFDGLSTRKPVYFGLTQSEKELKHDCYEKKGEVNSPSNSQLAVSQRTFYNLTTPHYGLANFSVNVYLLETTMVYEKNEEAFYLKAKKTETSSSDSKKGNVALYLNNTADFKDYTAGELAQSRLFVCCTQTDNEPTVKNIFSVLKNGNLYIGGQIQSAENKDASINATDLPDRISIKNAGIQITGNSLIINFSNIQDNRGRNLSEYINDAVSPYSKVGHTHSTTLQYNYQIFPLMESKYWNPQSTNGNGSQNQDSSTDNPFETGKIDYSKDETIKACTKAIIAFFMAQKQIRIPYVSAVEVKPSTS